MEVPTYPREINKKREERTTGLLQQNGPSELSGAQRMGRKDSESNGISSSRKRTYRRSPEDILKVIQDQQQQRQKSRLGK